MEGQSGRKRKISELHHIIKSKLLFDYLDDCGPKAKRFCFEARQFLESESDKAEDDPLKMMDILEARGHIAPGKYGNLMEIVKPIDNRIVNYIKEKEDEIKKIPTEDEEMEDISSLSDVARNIHRSTELEIVEHQRDKTFVSLPSVSEGEAILDKFGILVIVGKSGSGKSKCALEILSSRKKSGNNLIFKLSSMDYWHEVVNPNKKLHILFDDLFEKRVDQSLRCDKSIFETIMSTAKYGNVKVIFTMNDKAQEIYKPDFNDIFREDMFLYIETKTLSRENKLDIFKSHLSNKDLFICSDDQYFTEKYRSPQEVRNKYLSQSEVDAILQTDPFLGYPLCCYLFSSVKENFCQGIAFFKDASNKLIDAIDGLRFSSDAIDIHGFCVLVYAAFRDGKVDPDEIDEKLALSILIIMHQDNNEDHDFFMRKGISALQKSYFFNAKKPEVYHRSIIRATMVSFSKVSVDAKEKVLDMIDPLTFLEIVDIDDKDDPQNSYRVSLSRARFSLAVAILEHRIQTGELSILNTKLLENDAFVDVFLEKLPKTLCEQTFIYACKFNKALVVRGMQRLGDIKISISQETMTKGFKMACLCGNRQIVESLIGQTTLSSNSILAILHPVRFNTDLAIHLIRKMQLSSCEHETLINLSKILVRDECQEVLKFLHDQIICPNDIKLYQANLAGRRRSLPMVRWFIDTYPSMKTELVTEMLKGACIGGSRSVLKYLFENYRDEQSNTSNDSLGLACETGDPAIVEELLKCDRKISKLEIGESLRMACFKGFCQVVRVLLTNTECLNKTDIMEGISHALKGNQNGPLVVLQEFYDISDDIIKDLREEVNKNVNTGPFSSMPFTPAPYKSIPSVNISTPGIFYQKHRNQTPRRVLKKVLSQDQLLVQMEKYKRCQKIWKLSADEYEASQIRHLLCQKPELQYELLTETIQNVVKRGHAAILNVFLDIYPDLQGSILKELIFDGNPNRSIMQCIQNRFECNMMQYIAFARNKSIPIEKLLTCLSRNRCLFPPVEIMTATEEMTKQDDVDCIKILLSSLSEITETYTINKMFLDACRDGKLCIVQTLLGEKYITDSLITDAFDQCCVYEEAEIMKLLLKKRQDLFQDEFMYKAIDKCCKGRYLSSLYFLLNTCYSESDSYRNMCLSLLIQNKDKDVLLVLLSRCRKQFRKYDRQEKFYKELLMRASLKNTLILRLSKEVDEEYFDEVNCTTKVKALRNLLQNRLFEGINLWSICPRSEKQLEKYFSVLFSDELIKETFLGVSVGMPTSIFTDAISFLAKHKEKEKLSQMLTRDIRAVHNMYLKYKSNELKEFVYDCLPPLSQELERTIVKWSECKIDHFKEDVECEFSGETFLFLAKHYEFSKGTVDRVHVRMCLTDELDVLQLLWEKVKPTFNEECLNSACCNKHLSVLPSLIDLDNFPKYVIKLTEYTLFYILIATITYFDSPVRHTLVNIIHKNEHDSTDLTEPLCNSSDLVTVWKELTGLFRDEITNEIVIKVTKLCCKQNRRENFKLLLFLNKKCKLPESNVLDCCMMIMNLGVRNICYWEDGLSTCSKLLKNLPLSQSLEVAKAVTNNNTTLFLWIFPSRYVRTCGYDNDFGKVCKRWEDFDYNHPYYRKRVLSILDEFANT